MADDKDKPTVLPQRRDWAAFGAGIVAFAAGTISGLGVVIGVMRIAIWIDGPAEVIRFDMVWVFVLAVPLGVVVGRGVARGIAQWLASKLPALDRPS